MSVLPGGQSLDRALPDLEDLLADPHAYLVEAPLAFGPRRMYRLAVLFALPALALLAFCHIEEKFDSDRIAVIVGLLIGSLVWFFWTLMMRDHEMVLHHDGIEVIHRDTTIWAPWALFHVEGRPFVPESDSPRAGLLLPIDPKMVPHVQLRRGGMVVAWGRQVEGPQWRFTARDEIVLPGRYEISTQDVGELLLVLGHRLGESPPREAPPPEAEAEPPSEGPPADPEGWITVPLTRLRLPPCCARCAGPRDDVIPLRVMARGDWLVWFLVGMRVIEVPVPVCEACKDYVTRRQRNTGAIGLAIGAVLGAGIGVALGSWLGEGRAVPLWLGTFAGLFLGSFAGSVVSLGLSRAMPVRVRNYSPSRGLVSVRFDNPVVAHRVLENLRQVEEPPPDPPTQRM